MSELSNFSKWLKKSLDKRLIYQKHDDYCIVIDGYVGYKISYDNRPYIEEIKRQTFQDLEEDFIISYREIKIDSIKSLDDVFEIKKECKETKLYFQHSDCKLKVFMVNDEYVFVNEKYLERIETKNYTCYGEGNHQPVVFKNEYLSYVILPVRVHDFNYSIIVNTKK